MTGNEADPGWRPALSRTVRSLNPFHVLKRVKTIPQDGLTVTRSILLSIVYALFVFVIVLTVIAPTRAGDIGPFPYLVAAAGLISISAVTWLVRRPLAAGDEKSLASAWRTRFFVGLGFAEAAAMLGFLGAIITGRIWVYTVRLAFALLGIWEMAPSRRNLGRDQERIRERGSTLNLTRALIGQRPQDSPE
jgi:F0F1-type ATP synthase membrane subunit c/vacuolar-type H+-ATPase subunit K